MAFLGSSILLLIIAIVLNLFINVPWKGIVTVVAVTGIGIMTSIVAFKALAGNHFEYWFQGSLVTGPVRVDIDALSGWFILIINFIFITGSLYGLDYMKTYRVQKASLALHSISLLLVHSSLIAICALQNSIAFLIAWEIMALSSFFLIIFEHHKNEILKAGINFLIQSHVCIMALTLGFLWVALNQNSFDFNAIPQFVTSHSMLTGVALFLCFFLAFAIKAGFVPFHTWLPHAHPAAPAHISGIMSGVIIKIGIYGILRMLLLIKSDYVSIGYFIFFISIVSGIYGVMLAIIQHNLKRLLAYHSIENIGIIGMGIGIGCIGMGKGSQVLTVLGFSAALLHTLNHSLFKSLLFYGAGNVYQAAHTMDIDKLGGLNKVMPHTAFLFLLASLAICGLPPFNGFVSEFLIYYGMFTGLPESGMVFLSFLVWGILGLALIGGLALLCFTKAFGSVFLGIPRHHFHHHRGEAGFLKLIPMYTLVVIIVSIGLFPKTFIGALSGPVELFTSDVTGNFQLTFSPVVAAIKGIGTGAAGFLFLAILIYFVRRQWTRNRVQQYNITWICGYTGSTSKMQYTASSFVRGYRKLAEPVLSIRKIKKEISGVFPVTGGQVTHPQDRLEEWFVYFPILLLKKFFNRFVFLQNGNLRFYILYGVVFITLVLVLPSVIEYFISLIHFLNSL